ncbi:MAG: hypothetical protein R2749_06995 [Acidimicrobiales bacterium]
MSPPLIPPPERLTRLARAEAHSAADWVATMVAICVDTSTSCPRPLRARSSSASRAPPAAWVAPCR